MFNLVSELPWGWRSVEFISVSSVRTSILFLLKVLQEMAAINYRLKQYIIVSHMKDYEWEVDREKKPHHAKSL